MTSNTREMSDKETNNIRELHKREMADGEEVERYLRWLKSGEPEESSWSNALLKE